MHVHIALADGSDGLARAARLRQTQTGDRDSLNGLMAEHDGLVQAVVRQQALSDLPFAKALQAGRVGLWRAILGYAPQRGIALSAHSHSQIGSEESSAARRASAGSSSTSARNCLSICNRRL